MFTVAMLRARASRTAEQAGGFGDANAAQPEQSRSPTPRGEGGGASSGPALTHSGRVVDMPDRRHGRESSCRAQALT